MRPKCLGFHATIVAWTTIVACTIVSTIKPYSWPKSVLQLRAADSKEDRKSIRRSTAMVSLLCSEAMLGNNSGWLQLLCCKPPTLFWIEVCIVSCGIGDHLIPVLKGLASDRYLQLLQSAEKPYKHVSMEPSACRTARSTLLSMSYRGARAVEMHLKNKNWKRSVMWKNPGMWWALWVELRQGKALECTPLTLGRKLKMLCAADRHFVWPSVKLSNWATPYELQGQWSHD